MRQIELITPKFCALLILLRAKFDQPPYCFRSRRQIVLSAAPVVYNPQELLGNPHLKQAIVGAFRWATKGGAAISHRHNFRISSGW